MRSITHLSSQTKMKNLIILPLLLILSSCATIIHGTKQKIKIISNPNGSQIFVNGKKAGITPAIVTLKRKDLIEIQVSHPGYEDKVMAFRGKVEKKYLIGDALLSLPTFGLPFIIDGSSGAALRFKFDSLTFNLDLKNDSVKNEIRESIKINNIQKKEEQLLKNDISLKFITLEINKIKNEIANNKKSNLQSPKNIISFDILPLILQAAFDNGNQQFIQYSLNYERFIAKKWSVELSFIKKNPTCLNCLYHSSDGEDDFNVMKFTETFQGGITLKRFWKKGFHSDLGFAYRYSHHDKAEILFTATHPTRSDNLHDVVETANDYKINFSSGYRFKFAIKENFILLDFYTILSPYFRYLYYTQSTYPQPLIYNHWSGDLQFGIKLGYMFR